MSWLFVSGGQSFGASASASVLPMSIPGWFFFFFFSINWFDLLAVQGTRRSLLQHHSLKVSIFWHSAFFMVQLLTIVCNHWEDHSLDYTTFVSRVMSLLFTTLSRFVTAFLSRSNHLLISWLQSPPAVILESKKRKSVTISTFSPSTCHEVMETLVRFLGQEDPLEKGQATHSIILGLPWWLTW